MPPPEQRLLDLDDPPPVPALSTQATTEALRRMADLMGLVATGRLPRPATEVDDEILR